jgi:hypothetical protein
VIVFARMCECMHCRRSCVSRRKGEGSREREEKGRREGEREGERGEGVFERTRGSQTVSGPLPVPSCPRLFVPHTYRPLGGTEEGNLGSQSNSSVHKSVGAGKEL